MEAVQAVQEHTTDVVLLDISMPVMDGLEAARCIRENAPSIKIIFVTSQTDPAVMSSAFQCGANGYVGKGCLADLYEAFQAVLEGGQYPLGKASTEAV